MKFESFQDKVAVVTGATSGIGKAIAEQLANEGAVVIVVGHKLESAERVATEIGGHAAQVDVTDPKSVQELANDVLAQHGKVDIVVNNAGVGPLSHFEDLTLEDFHWVMNTNFWGIVHGLKSFVPLLTANPEGGAIVNTASIAALITPPGATAYAASKAAVMALSETVGAELADKNIHVLTLVPAVVRTQINENAKKRPSHNKDSAPNEDFLPPLPLREPHEVGAMVVDGLRGGEKYVFTHRETQVPVSAKAEEILNAHARIPH